MKSFILLIAGIAMSVTLACAQTSATTIPAQTLSIGGDATNLVFSNIIHYPSKQTSVPELKGKLIILDFWATWCPPCVAAFSKFETIQKKWPDKVLILPVTTEKKEIVEHFYKLHPQLRLPSMIEDSTLQLLFPHVLIPHEVVIGPDGKIIAITGSDDITLESVEKLLNNAAADIPVKKDVMKFNPYAPLLTDENNEMEHEILFRSMVLPCVMGIGSGSGLQNKINGKVVGFNHVNTLIPHLYLFAFNRPPEWIDSRLVMENVKDPERYRSSNNADYSSVATEWSRKNTFCYDIIAPGVADSTRRKIMLETLNAYFGTARNMHGSLEIRKMPCFKLTRIPNRRIPTSKAKSKAVYSMEGVSYNTQVTMKEMAAWIENEISSPVTDATGYKKSIDYQYSEDFEWKSLKGDRKPMKELLEKNGLRLVKSIQPIEVLVFKEN